MNSCPLVSIIIPAYNTDIYIYRCLNSIKDQTYKQIDVIIVDDGSVDATAAICREFVEADHRFRIISKNNTGVSDSRNVGVTNAKGKYILFVDSDDYVVDDYVSTLVSCMEKNKTQLACAEYYLVEDETPRLHVSMLPDGDQQVLSAGVAVNLLHEKTGFQGYLWNKIFLRDVVVENHLMFDAQIKVWEDMLFVLQYLECIERVAYINKPIYYYIQRQDSAMANDSTWREGTQLKALQKMWTLIQTSHGGFHDYIRDFYANELVGRLEKYECVDKDAICAAIQKIGLLHGKLSVKHRVKLVLYRIKYRVR